MANILPVSPARASSGTAPLADRGALRGAVVLAVVTLAGFGFLYSLAGVGIGQALFPQAADGSLVERGSRIVGSALVAQPFAGERYFQPRPSAAGYDTMALTGSNQARTNPDLRKRLEEARAAVAMREGVAPSAVPGDLYTQSGSGIDPHVRRSTRRSRWRASRVRGALPAMPSKGWWPAIPRAGSSASSVRRASTCWP